jgi:N-acetylglutamate synthase-like GNAT family acetyltransferase
MPQGPNGVPRLTDIGPIVADIKDVNEDDIWIETKRNSNKRIESKFLEYKSFTDDFQDVEGDERGEIVTIEMKYEEWDTVLGDTDFFTYTGGSIRYAITDIGYIHKVKVNPDFRRFGIGTELMEIALNDMRNEDIKTVYTKAISEAGDELTDEFGFRLHDELNTLNPRNEWKVKEL